MSDNVLNTPGLMDPSTEFGNIMQHAMKIKGAQMEQDRKSFETWPLYFQNTLWMQGAAIELREKPLEERLTETAKLKEAGNEFFKKKVGSLSVLCLGRWLIRSGMCACKTIGMRSCQHPCDPRVRTFLRTCDAWGVLLLCLHSRSTLSLL